MMESQSGMTGEQEIQDRYRISARRLQRSGFRKSGCLDQLSLLQRAWGSSDPFFANVRRKMIFPRVRSRLLNLGNPDSIVLNMDAVAESEWAGTNAEWLNAAIQRGDNIWLVTDPAAHTALMNSIGRTSYYLDLELPTLEEYRAHASFMWP